MNMKSINPDTCCSNCKRYGTTPAKFPIWCSDNDCKCHQPTMNQIPNIEETHSTRESAKKVLREYYGYKSEQDVPDGLAAVLEDWLHHQLQKARQDWLRSEIEKLEGEKLPYPYVCKSPFPGEGVDFHLKTYGHLPYFGCCKYDQLTKDETDVYNQALTSIITRYKEELKVLEDK